MMREYRREPARVRAEIEDGLREYEEVKVEFAAEAARRARIARCGTALLPSEAWFLLSLAVAAGDYRPDIIAFPESREGATLH